MIQHLGPGYRISSADIEAINRLLAQLTDRAQPVTIDDILDVMEFSDLFVFRDAAGAIVGMTTLTIVSKLLGREGHVEDIVVDASCRRQGVGKALMEAVIERARELNLRVLLLTSRPQREAANRLYRRIGFTPYETNPYSMVL